jgi:hypothetical protein
MHHRCEASHGISLVDVNFEILDQILEDRHAATVTSSMEGVCAEEVGVGQGVVKPFPLSVNDLCNLYSDEKNEMEG